MVYPEVSGFDGNGGGDQRAAENLREGVEKQGEIVATAREYEAAARLEAAKLKRIDKRRFAKGSCRN